MQNADFYKDRKKKFLMSFPVETLLWQADKDIKINLAWNNNETAPL
jgi:hypothetical protein